MPRATIPPLPGLLGSTPPRWLSPATLAQSPTWTDVVALGVHRDTATDPITFVWRRQRPDDSHISISAEDWPLLVRCVTDVEGNFRLHITTQALLITDPDNATPSLLSKTLPYNALEALSFARFEAIGTCQCCGNPPARLDGGIGVVDIRENKAIFNWNLAEGWVVLAPTVDDVTVYYADAQILTDCTKKC